MAYKRNLYRPASGPSDPASQKRNRKPLAQGRLVSENRAESSKRRPVLASGIESVSSRDTGGGDVSVSLSTVGNEATTQSQVGRGDYTVTPRKMAPQVTENRSPAQTRPVNTLDLSDSDPDLSLQYKSPGVRVHTQRPQEVLVLDASRQIKNLSEVDVVVGYEKSPVRVVCHSPATTEAGLRNSAKQGRHRKVNMDTIPTLSFAEDAKEDLKENQQIPGRFKSPIIIKEKLSGSSKGPFTCVDNRGVVTQMEVMGQDLPRIPQPNFEDSPESDKVNTQAAGDVQSVVSDSDACSVNELVTKPTKKVKKGAQAIKASAETSKSTKTPTTAKKTKQRVVQSRYMQSAQSKAKASLSVMLDQSKKNDSRMTKTNKSLELPNKSVKQNRAKVTSKRINSAPESGPQASPRTPDISQTSSSQKTSTPTMDDSLFHHEIDASAIHADISALSTASDVSRVQRGHKGTHQLDVTDIMKNMSVSYSADNMKNKKKVTQHHLDLLYSRYVQWLYLESKAKKDQEEQEKQAMAQIYWLYQEVQKLRAKKHETEKELVRLRHFNDADEQIDLQRQDLGPTTNNLPTLTQQYETLAHALDTTRHQIQTKEVYLPDDQDQLQRQLEQALIESEYLLGELSVMTRQPAVSVNSMSNALVALDQAVNIQSDELKQCGMMLAATQSLARQEQSLQVQAIQTCET